MKGINREKKNQFLKWEKGIHVQKTITSNKV
jgi:hypothetical protein